MDILTSSQMGNKRILAILTVMLLGMIGMLPLMSMVSPSTMVNAEGSIQEGTLSLKPGERSGVHNLATSPPEYELRGKNNYAHFGAKMLKLDINGDGVEDLAVTAHQESPSGVFIYDGASDITFPDLKGSPSSATWSIIGSSYTGADIATGDANGDGYDDILVSNCYNENSVYMFFGGPDWDSRTTVSTSSADVTFYGYEWYNNFGLTMAMGDLDGDGYDDVIISESWYYEYGPPYYYWSEPGKVYWWYGSSSWDSWEDSYSYDAYVIGHSEWYDKDYYNYCDLGLGGMSTGDMNGDGQDELAIGTQYNQYNYDWYCGTVFVMYPHDDIRDFSTGTAYIDDTYMDWVMYQGTEYMLCLGCDPEIFDYNGDGYADLTIGSGWYQYYTGYPSGKYVWIVDGSSTVPSGLKEMNDNSNYAYRFESSGVSGIGSHAWGDYDGDGLYDLAIGGVSPGTVYVLLNEQIITSSSQEIDVSTIATLTINAPSGTTRFAWCGEYYTYYYYPNYDTLIFYNRDDDGCDDIFVSDPYYNNGTGYENGIIWGISNFDMFGIGSFQCIGGDLPDGETYYAEYKPYTFRGSAWNKWDIFGTDTMVWTFVIGEYTATVKYENFGGLKSTGTIAEIDDFYDILTLDASSLNLSVDEPTNMLFVTFNVTFTDNLPLEGDLDILFHVRCQHIYYDQTIEDVGRVRNRFRYVGELETYYKTGWNGEMPAPADMTKVKSGAWMPENTYLLFTGMKLVYNGTEDFMEEFGIEPYCPGNGLFHMIVKNSLGDSYIDDSSSGKDFQLILEGGDLPLEIIFDIEQEGISPERVLNSVPEFKAKVDTDVPSIPPGIRVHADAFDDPNTVVDNDGELYVTWHLPTEFNSGLDHYEVECTGGEGIIMAEANFAKVTTTESGEIEVKVRAVDRVNHIGEWGYSSIDIDLETLVFSSFVPEGSYWFDTLTPEVGITVQDIGGRAVLGASVEYSTSYDEGATWNAWTSAGITTNAQRLDVRITPLMMEGQSNLIKFRALDEAGNIAESDAYVVKTDISGVEFGDLMVDGSTDWMGNWIADGTVDLSIELIDGFSGVDGTSIEYRYTSRSRADLNTATWRGIEGVPSTGTATASVEGITFEKGDRNFVQFRAKDLIGNGYSYTEALNIWVNTDPEPVISSPEDGGEYLENEPILFDATFTSDVDGDTLSYIWEDTVTYNEETATVELSDENITDYSNFEFLLGPGDHSIVLVVSDGIHEVRSAPIEIKVLPYIDPIWLTSADTDGDGMPNYWEYMYHLGWNNDLNRDSLYDPTAHAGKTPKDLYNILYDDYKNGLAEVTPDNDADGDKHTDLEEYLAGTDPTDAMAYPLYSQEGENPDEVQDIFLIVLIIAAIIILAFIMLLLFVNSSRNRMKLRQGAARDAEEEKVLAQNMLASGGNERLAALKSASEGKPMALSPVAVPQQALPSTQGAPAEPVQPMPVAAQPTDLQAAPAPVPVNTGVPVQGQGPMV